MSQKSQNIAYVYQYFEMTSLGLNNMLVGHGIFTPARSLPVSHVVVLLQSEHTTAWVQLVASVLDFPVTSCMCGTSSLDSENLSQVLFTPALCFLGGG